MAAWPQYSEFFARTATNLVGMGHVLQLGSGTIEGRLARALKDTALEGRLAKARDKLVANPADAKILTHFYVKATEAKKRPHAAAGSGKPRITMTFSPSPSRAAPDKQRLTELIADLREFDVAQPEAKKALKKLAAAINETAANLEEGVWEEVVGDMAVEQTTADLLDRIKRAPKRPRK